jgi:hypothetical protein
MTWAMYFDWYLKSLIVSAITVGILLLILIVAVAIKEVFRK